MSDSPVMSVGALRSVPLFASVGDEDARALVGLLKPRSLPRGALLFRQGDAGDAMYLVEAGRVRIFVTDEDGEELTLAELARGDFFGEMALIDGKSRTASARALDDARLCSLSREDFLSFVRKNSDVALAMVKAISERLRRTDELLRRRVSRNANVEDAARLTFADRFADRLTEFGGSWAFISVTIVLIALWVIVNSIFMRGQGPDPYPYSFLDVMNGIVAALLTPVILISQKRQSEKDRLKADLDFQINLKNELAIAEVLRRLDVLESERLPALIAASRAQPADGASSNRPTV